MFLAHALRVLAIVLPGVCLAGERQAFDAYTYETPPGYARTMHADAVEWSRVDQERQFYCQIGLYRARPTSGSAAQDLDQEWKTIVADSFAQSVAPVTREMPLPQAPTSLLRGGASLDGNGNPILNSLFLLRFSRHYVGVLFNAPSEDALTACQEDIALVVRSLQIAGEAMPPTPVPPSSGPAPPSASTSAPASSMSLVGTWERVVASLPPTTYNPFTRLWEYSPAAALNQFKNVTRWRFDPSGRYEFELDAESFNRQERSRVIERGDYAVAGDTIQLRPREAVDGKGPMGRDVTLAPRGVPAPYAVSYSVGEHPTFKESPGLQVRQSDGSWETFKAVR